MEKIMKAQINRKPIFLDEITPEMVKQTVNARFPDLTAFLERVNSAMYTTLYYAALHNSRLPMESPKALAMIPQGGYEFEAQNLYAAVHFMTAVCNDAAEQARFCGDIRELASISAMEVLLS
jgi:hypothetical protein